MKEPSAIRRCDGLACSVENEESDVGQVDGVRELREGTVCNTAMWWIDKESRERAV